MRCSIVKSNNNFAIKQTTFCDFYGSWSIGSVQVDFLDELNIWQQRNKGHKEWEGNLRPWYCSYEILFHLKWKSKNVIFLKEKEPFFPFFCLRNFADKASDMYQISLVNIQ